MPRDVYNPRHTPQKSRRKERENPELAALECISLGNRSRRWVPEEVPIGRWEPVDHVRSHRRWAVH